MIITLTLNPALDETIEVETLERGALNNVIQTVTDLGGKGINVSKALKALGGKSQVMGFAAGKTGLRIVEELRSKGIPADFIPVCGENRTNIKIVDYAGTLTELNEKGPEISKGALEELFRRITEKAGPDTTFVFSGSIPAGVPDEIYQTLIEAVHAKGSRVLLDADGAALRLGIEAKPEIIKPNQAEMLRYFGLSGDCPLPELLQKAESLLDKGIEVILLSLGDAGAAFISREASCYCPALEVTVHSTVGAGDAMAAAWIYAGEQDLSFEESVRLCMAVSAGAVMTRGTKPPEQTEVNKLKEQVTLCTLQTKTDTTK